MAKKNRPITIKTNTTIFNINEISTLKSAGKIAAQLAPFDIDLYSKHIKSINKTHKEKESNLLVIKEALKDLNQCLPVNIKFENVGNGDFQYLIIDVQTGMSIDRHRKHITINPM